MLILWTFILFDVFFFGKILLLFAITDEYYCLLLSLNKGVDFLLLFPNGGALLPVFAITLFLLLNGVVYDDLICASELVGLVNWDKSPFSASLRVVEWANDCSINYKGSYLLVRLELLIVDTLSFLLTIFSLVLVGDLIFWNLGIYIILPAMLSWVYDDFGLGKTKRFNSILLLFLYIISILIF